MRCVFIIQPKLHPEPCKLTDDHSHISGTQ